MIRLPLIGLGVCASAVALPAAAQSQDVPVAPTAAPAPDAPIVPVDTTAPDGPHRRVSISPYIDLSQVVTGDFNSGDVVTYSTVSVGVDATIQTRRVQIGADYEYTRNIYYDHNRGDDDAHSGLVRAEVAVAPGLGISAGALATRTRTDIRGAAPGILTGNVDNVSQVYSAYIGPSLEGHAGAIGYNASYRFAYTKVEAPTFRGYVPGPTLDTYDHSTSHLFSASFGSAAGRVLPVGFTISGAYELDDASQLDQRYEDRVARADFVLPVARTVALDAGVGYEHLTISQRDAVQDAAGNPVVDNNGRYVTDRASPRRIAYDTDGLIYDAGVTWRPSPRTTLEARVGWRYGNVIYTGSVSYQASDRVGLQVGVYDSVETFGRQLRDGIASLPTSFVQQRDAFSQQFSGCTYGVGGQNPGGCLNGVFQSASTASYRAQGVDAVLSAQKGSTHFGAGIGYAQRRFFVPGNTGVVVNGTTDRSYYAQAYAGTALTRRSSIEGNIFADYYESGFGGDGVFSTGATGQVHPQLRSPQHLAGRRCLHLQPGGYRQRRERHRHPWHALSVLIGRKTMYDDHYGFTGRPFQLTPDPRFWFDTSTHRKAMAYLGYGLSQGEGFIVITGDVGAGKTTLVGHLMATIDRERLNVIKLVSTQIEAVDLLRLVAEAMQVASDGLTKAQLLTAIERQLHAMARSGKRTLLIVDEAQALPTSSLEELRMLSNFQTGSHSLLQIFLLGQPEFRERLHGSDRLEQLRQRVIAVHHLDPMGRDEVEPYMVHRLRLVGWDGRPRFTPAAHDALFQASDGVPRRLNQIAGRVLLAGAVERLELIDGAVVERVVADLAGDARPTPIAAPVAEPEPVASHGPEAPAEVSGAPAPDLELVTEEPELDLVAEVPESVTASDEPEQLAPVGADEVEAAATPEAPANEAIATPQPEPIPSAWQRVELVEQLPVADVPDAQEDVSPEIAERLAALEARVEEQDAALRRMLTLLVDWVEGDGRTDRSLRSA